MRTCRKPWCRCRKRKCRKYGSYNPWFPALRAWVWYGWLQDAPNAKWGQGHTYICLFCGRWHWTHRNRGRGLVRWRLSPAQHRALDRMTKGQ